MNRYSPSVEILAVANDLIIEVRELKNVVTGGYLNAATVTCTLKDAAGANVSGQSWPMALAYVTSSNGVYRGTLPYTLGLSESARYTLHVDVDGGAGLRGHWEVPCLARVRV